VTRLLVVEDDVAIADALVDGLAREGFEVEYVATGAGALAASAPDLVVLDLALPDLDGQEVFRRLRARSTVPVIVATARDDELDRVLLLELGADDYIVKPFGMRELVARVRAVLRRSAGPPPDPPPDPPQVIGTLVVDQRRRRSWLGGREILLTPKEFDLLALLAAEPGAVLTREHILEQVWDPHWWGPTKTLDVHVAALRRKLGDPRWITTVRGVGYRLEPP
jgi:DNA-binding response OmpR family regulator